MPSVMGAGAREGKGRDRSGHHPQCLEEVCSAYCRGRGHVPRCQGFAESHTLRTATPAARFRRGCFGVGVGSGKEQTKRTVRTTALPESLPHGRT